MEKITPLLALLLCLSLIGCGEVNPSSKFFSEWENVSTDMANAISKDDVDGARAIFDAKKESLTTQCKAIKNTNLTETEKKLIARRVERIYSILTKATPQRYSQVESKKIETMINEFIDVCAD